MATLTVNLPDDLAMRAQRVGLLSDTAIRELLEAAVRRAAGRRMLGIAEQLHANDIPPLSDDEIIAEVKAVRTERKARDAGCT